MLARVFYYIGQAFCAPATSRIGFSLFGLDSRRKKFKKAEFFSIERGK
jgi:hypothetical protein